MKFRNFILLIGLICSCGTYADKPACKPYAHKSICMDCFSVILNTGNLLEEEKINKLDTCKQVCQKNHEYEFYLADHLMYIGKLEAAEQLLNGSITKYKDDTKKLEHLLMHLYCGMNRFDELLTMANNTIKKYPQWFSGYYFKGAYYIIQYDSSELLDKGQSLLNKSISKNDNVESHLMLTAYYYKKNEFENSLMEYKKAYNVDRILAISGYNFGTMAAQSAMNLNKLQTAEWILKIQEKFVQGIDQYEGYQQAWQRLNELKGKINNDATVHDKK